MAYNKQNSDSINKLNFSEYDLLMNTIVEDVATGKKIVFFPRGVFIFLLVMMLLPVFATVLLGGGSIKWFGADFSHGEAVFAQFITGIIDIVIMIGSFMMILRGHKQYVRVAKFYILFLMCTSLLFIIYYGAIYGELNISFLISAMISVLILCLMKGQSYQWFVEYMYRLQKRKRELENSN